MALTCTLVALTLAACSTSSVSYEASRDHARQLVEIAGAELEGIGLNAIVEVRGPYECTDNLNRLTGEFRYGISLEARLSSVQEYPRAVQAVGRVIPNLRETEVSRLGLTNFRAEDEYAKVLVELVRPDAPVIYVGVTTHCGAVASDPYEEN